MTKIKLPYKMLIYDIETSPLQAWIWRPGEQRVGHDQLVVNYDMYEILTLAYKWYGDKQVHILTGDNIIEQFDELVKQSDVTIGKNSDNFDVKHINTQRMLKGLPPMPQWINQAEDLEKQLRKYFAFPSQSLDYIAKLMGTGGKVKMERQDWIDIMNHRLLNRITEFGKFSHAALSSVSIELFDEQPDEIINLGIKAMNKMIKYNKKDVMDTEFILDKALPHIKLRKNAGIGLKEQGLFKKDKKEVLRCITCGSDNIIKGKIVTAGKTKYEEFECLDHKGYAGRATWYYKGQSHCKTYSKLS